jgi:hypothetical protein
VLRCGSTVVEAQETYASVCADLPSEYQVTIPKSVTLDGKTKSGTYTVGISGELSEDEILSVTQEKIVSMTRDDGASVSGTIVQNRTKWSSEDLTETGEGIISASDLTAGDWNGTFSFTISTLERETFEETITYNDFTLTANNYYMAGITRSGDVVIPETFEYDGVYYRTVKIGNAAFSDCKELKSVILPDSITTIGYSAFLGCISLKNINIPEGVTTIYQSAFHTCKSLQSIDFPNSLTYLGSYVIYECQSLKSIYIPSNVTTMANQVFRFSYNYYFNKIYCGAAESQPGWGKYWNYYADDDRKFPVVYNVTREEYETLYKK